jgi:hypothetical protein
MIETVRKAPAGTSRSGAMQRRPRVIKTIGK